MSLEVLWNGVAVCRVRACIFRAGHFSVAFNDTYYQLAQRHADVPRLTAAQQEVRRADQTGSLKP